MNSRLSFSPGQKVTSTKWHGFCESLATELYHPTVTDKSCLPKDPVAVVYDSDTHNTKPPIPTGDHLIHEGDCLVTVRRLIIDC